MTDYKTRWRRLTYVWIFVCAGLFSIIYAVVQDNKRLHDELAKPVRLTMQEKHQVITEYHTTMTEETKWALRKIIGCTNKE